MEYIIDENKNLIEHVGLKKTTFEIFSGTAQYLLSGWYSADAEDASNLGETILSFLQKNNNRLVASSILLTEGTPPMANFIPVSVIKREEYAAVKDAWHISGNFDVDFPTDTCRRISLSFYLKFPQNQYKLNCSFSPVIGSNPETGSTLDTTVILDFYTL